MTTIQDIASFLGAEAVLEFPGPCGPEAVISGPAASGRPRRETVVFVGMTVREPLEMLRASQAGLAIVDSHLRSKSREFLSGGIVQAVIWSSNPRLDFCRVLERYFSPPRAAGIDPAALVSPAALIGERCSIGPGCVISEGVEIGDDSVLYGRVFIYPGTRIGKRVIIHAGAVLGADGFGFEKRPDGSWQKFPHLGGVVVGDDVEVGANSTIDRGTLGDTVVERGVKIDNLVHIAHNAQVGADSLIISGAVICGGARVGARTWVAPQACIRDRITVGGDATIGMGAIVNSDTAPGATMVAWHARPALATKRIFTFLQRIADADPASGTNPTQKP